MITLDDLIARFGEKELVERSNKGYGDSMDAAVIQRAIADAEAEAQSYVRLAGLGKLLAPSAALLGFVCDIARYRLYDDAVHEVIEERYKRAIEWLKEAAKHPQMLDDALNDASAGETAARYVGCAVMPNAPPQWADLG